MESAAAPVDQRRILDHLIRADLFEQVLQSRYLGTKRFSLEGNHRAYSAARRSSGRRRSKIGAQESVLGMSHRGRLNVMVHIAVQARRQFLPDLKMSIPAACSAAAT